MINLVWEWFKWDMDLAVLDRVMGPAKSPGRGMVPAKSLDRGMATAPVKNLGRGMATVPGTAPATVPA
ncbi:MAG: hypothetical protein MJA84_13415 [Firmicutes bacterium]|nr:hypothetical protein [Bacillota bacterium]